MSRTVSTTACTVLLLSVAGCSGSGDEGLAEDAVDYTRQVEMTLEVTGTATSVDLRLSVGGEITEANDRAVPLTSPSGEPVTFTLPLSSRLSAEATIGSAGGSITCRLLDQDGAVVDTGQASGASASTTCEGWPPPPETASP